MMLDMTVTCSSGFLCLEIYPNLKVSLPIIYVWMPPGSEFDYASSTGRQKAIKPAENTALSSLVRK
jgi:hypothetical protein